MNYILRMIMDKITPEVTKTVDDILRAWMGRWGFTGARITADVDHYGDPILQIDVDYRLMEEPLDTSITYGLISRMRRALESVGENRFPHIRHHFDERQTTLKYRKPAKKAKSA